MATSPVIVNPEVFVERLSRYGQRYRKATIEHPFTGRRRHAYKHADMCSECLYGKHAGCTAGSCSCVHREEEI